MEICSGRTQGHLFKGNLYYRLDEQSMTSFCSENNRHAQEELDKRNTALLLHSVADFPTT